MDRVNRFFVPVMLFAALVAVSGCKKKTVAVTPTAPPIAVPAPTAKLSASPSVISAGDNVVLTWSTTNATSVSIDGIGDVSGSGVKTVTPSESTTYHLEARGSGGNAEADARVTVHAPPAIVKPAASTMSEEEEFRANVQDIFFDYDKADLREDAQAALPHDAAYLTSHPDLKIVIGGYCDERGSSEYNLALGQNRAQSVKKALVNDGIAASRMRVVSYGKEKPFCTQSTEDCWQKNRRAGFALDR